VKLPALYRRDQPLSKILHTANPAPRAAGELVTFTWLATDRDH
jgi:hypothetical protein